MAKQRSLKTVVGNMKADRRQRVVGRSVELAGKYQALQELRKARAKTQVQVAETLSVTQPYVAKLEQRSDLMLSVLRRYVRSVGGELELAVTFPDSDRIVLDGLGEAENDDRTTKQRGRRRPPGRRGGGA